mgnify:CR=1 FL=1
MNSPILKYDQFLNHKTLTESRRTLMVNIFNQFEDVKPYMNEAVFLVEAGIFDTAFDEELNEESLMAKMKAKFDNAMQIAKEKGKKALFFADNNCLRSSFAFLIIRCKVGNTHKARTHFFW